MSGSLQSNNRPLGAKRTDFGLVVSELRDRLIVEARQDHDADISDELVGLADDIHFLAVSSLGTGDMDGLCGEIDIRIDSCLSALPQPLVDSLRTEINKSRSELQDLIAKGDVDMESLPPECPEPPQDVYPPIWHKVRRMAEGFSLNDDEVRRAFEELNIPGLEVRLGVASDPEALRQQVARSIKVLESVMHVVPSSRFLVEHFVRCLKEGKSFEDEVTDECSMVFVDVSGFTKLVDQTTRIHGHAAHAKQAVSDCFKLMTMVANRFDAEVMRLGGDSMTLRLVGKGHVDRSRALGREIIRKLKSTEGALKVSMGHMAGHFSFRVLSDHSDASQVRSRTLRLGGQDYKTMLALEDSASSMKMKSQSKLPADHNGRSVAFDFNTALQGIFKHYLTTEDSLHQSLRAINRLSSLLLTFTPPSTSDKLLVNLNTDSAADQHEKITHHATVFIDFEGVPSDKEPLFYQIANRHARHLGGKINKTDGGKMLLSFEGLSAKAGDCERRAYECSVRILEDCESFADPQHPLRVGIDSGPTTSGNMGLLGVAHEYTYVGGSVNVAARLMALDKPDRGSIFVTGSVQSALKELAVNIERLPGMQRLKNVRGGRVVFDVSGLERRYGLDLKSLLQPDHEPLYGQREAVNAAHSRFQFKTLIKRSFCHISIEGESGMGAGKSARELLFNMMGYKNEFVGSFADTNDAYIREPHKRPALYAVGHEPHFQRHSFHACAELARCIAGVNANASFELQCDQAWQFFDELGLDSNTSSVLMRLMGFEEGDFNLVVIQDALQTLLSSLASSRTHEDLPQAYRRTQIFFFEDLQWCDEESHKVFSFLKRNLKDSPIAFLTTRRPSEGMPLEDEDPFSLEPLNEDQIRALIYRLLMNPMGDLEAYVLEWDERDEVHSAVLKLVSETSKGNPQLVAEVVHALIDQGYLQQGRLQPIKLPIPDQLSLKTSSNDLLAARIEHLKRRGVLSERSSRILRLLQMLGSPSPRFLLELLYARGQRDVGDLDSELALLRQHDVLLLDGDDVRFKRSDIQLHSLPPALEQSLFEAVQILETAMGEEGPLYSPSRHRASLKRLNGYDSDLMDFYADPESYFRALFQYSSLLKDSTRTHFYGSKLLEFFGKKPAMQRPALYYGEGALAAAQVLEKQGRSISPAALRQLLMGLSEQHTSVGASDDLKAADAYLDQCIAMEYDEEKEISEIYFCFDRLEVLLRKTQAVVMRAQRDPKPFEEIYELQKVALERLQELGESQDSTRFKLHELHAFGAHVLALRYRAAQFKNAGDLDSAKEELRKARFILEGIVLSKRYDTVFEQDMAHKVRFLFILSKTFEDLYLIPDDSDVEKKSFNTRVIFYLEQAVDLLESAPGLLMHEYFGSIVDIYTVCAIAQDRRDQSFEGPALALYESAFDIAHRSGNMTAVCLTLENLAHRAIKHERWDEVIRHSLLEHRKASEYQLLDRLGYACANLAYAYMKSGDLEDGRPYYEQLESLSVESHSKSAEFKSILNQYLNAYVM